MKKKPLIILVIIVVVISVFVALIKTGVIKLETYKDTVQEIEPVSIKSIPQLMSGKAYVYHGDNLEKDAEGYGDTSGSFEECGYSTLNYEIGDNYNSSGADRTRVIWVNSKDEARVPTLDANAGDKLVYSYLSTDEILPISFERFYDNGYTLGMSNMHSDSGNHILLNVVSSDKDAKTYINLSSDAFYVNELSKRFSDGVVYLDEIGGKKVTGDNLTTGGAIQGLEKDKSYICHFYTGTFFQDFVLTADNRCFSGFPNEFFQWNGFTFLHSCIVEITIPDFFKSGFYFVNGLGLFRYIAKGDTADSPTDDPIALFDEDGNLLNPEIYTFGEKTANETTTELSAKEKTDGAVSTEPVRKYTYNNKEGKKALITVNINGVPVDGKPAQVIITDPDGVTSSVDEKDGSASYTGDKAGTYQIVVSNVAGRDVNLVTE